MIVNLLFHLLSEKRKYKNKKKEYHKQKNANACSNLLEYSNEQIMLAHIQLQIQSRPSLIFELWIRQLY